MKKLVVNVLGIIVKKKSRKCPGHFEYKISQAQNKERKSMLEISITNEQKVTVTLNPVTAAGRPAALDGVPTWEVVTGDSTVVAAADGKSAVLTSSDNPGDTQVLVKADADLGEGVEEISDIVKLTVIGARAANLGLTAGAPEPK